MAEERIRIGQFLQARPDRAIRQPCRQGNNGDSAMPQAPRFNRRPTPSPTLIQIPEQLNISATDSFYGLCIVHPPIMVVNGEGSKPIQVT